MERSSRRVLDDDRLAGLWLQHTSSEYVFFAPVWLPPATEGRPGTFGLAQVDLRTAAGDYSRHIIQWWLFDRSGQRDAGELDRPALTFGQALRYVERLLCDRGIRMDAGDQAQEEHGIATGCPERPDRRQDG
ncbi:MAG: hypothetical protein ACR2QA_13995 [Solirubrobacteraceae bacterium]